MNTDISSRQITELRQALPLLDEKSKLGIIHFDSHKKAVDLIRWVDLGRPLTEKQNLLVGRLLQRAKRKHKNVDFKVSGTVDTDAIVAQVVAKLGMAGGDEKADFVLDTDAIASAVEKKVLAAVEKRAPRLVEIVVTRDDGKKHKVKGAKHAQFEHLVRVASSRLPNGYAPGIFLAGEASSGKTTGCEMLAEALGLKWYFNGAISMPHEMLGFVDGNGKYHRTPFRDAYEHGGVYTFDEVDRCDPVALLAVNPPLAGSIGTFPDKQIKRHKDCILTCTANTWGLGADANYSGATKLDAAFLSRYPIRLPWDIDPVLEAAIVPNAMWLERVRNARRRAREAGLKVMIDTRIAQAGAGLIAGGYTMDEAANFTYLANLKPEQRQIVES